MTACIVMGRRALRYCDRGSNPPPAHGWALYELRKAQWVADHPSATPDEHTRAMRAIADDLRL